MIAMLIIFIWIFSLFWNQASQSRTLASEKFTKLGKYLDIVKGLSRNYLIFSSQIATKKVAATLTTYYTNDPYPPTIDEIRYSLSQESLKLLNKYISNTIFKEAVFDYSISKYACVDFPIDEKKLSSGEYDEKFNVGSYGSSIEIKEDNNIVSSENDVFETVTRDRFFLLYRNFAEWSKTANFVDDTAICLTKSCGCFNPKQNCIEGTKSLEECSEFYSCFMEVLNNEKNRLVTMIADPYVECSVQPTCFTMRVDLNPVNYDLGEHPPPWDKAPSCTKTNGPERSNAVCSNELSFSSYEKSPINYEMIKFQSSGQSLPVCEVKIAYKATYSCVDKKYELSIPPAERELQFNVDITTNEKRWCR